MILHAGQSTVILPAEKVATVIVVHARSLSGRVKRSTAMMQTRTNPCPATAARGMPVYWFPVLGGAIGIYPAPDREYEIEAMGRDGKPIGGNRAPVQVPVVETMIAALAQAQEQQKREMAGPQRVERFSLIGDE